MRLKAIWLTTVSLSTLTLLAAVSLGESVIQLWTPEVAQAAKVTAHLIKRKSINPVLLTRRDYSQLRPARSMAITVVSSEDLLNYTLTQRLSLDYPVRENDRNAPSLLTSRKNQSAEGRQVPSKELFGSADGLVFQSRQNSLEETLKRQKYEIKKLELDLAKEQYYDGKISQIVFNQKAQSYQTALEEYQAFTHSSKMAD
uniref:Uncharacterized protein n=1 Tax=Oscillatoriales cyanobacterium SpSt-402 TaxID=2282168 RepID=A0A832M5I6_9CYAN